MTEIVDTMLLPACAKDLAVYKAAGSGGGDTPRNGGGGGLGGDRLKVYSALKAANDDLKVAAAKAPTAEPAAAKYYLDVAKPKMAAVQKAADTAEKLVAKGLWPLPSVADLVYAHHF